MFYRIRSRLKDVKKNLNNNQVENPTGIGKKSATCISSTWLHVAIIMFSKHDFILQTNTIYDHAEVNVLRVYNNIRHNRSIGHRTHNRISLYSIRIRYIDGQIEIGNSEPCYHCCKYIKNNGVNSVQYSACDGQLHTSYLDNKHISRANRY